MLPMWVVCVCTYQRGLQYCLFGVKGNTRASNSGTAIVRVPLFFCVLLNSFFLLIYLKLRPTRIRDYGMKKILLAIIVFAFSSGIYAQTHEFGVVVGAKSGLSHKFKIENFAVQTDLLAGSICTVIEDWGDFYTSDIFQFTLNCNLLYNKDYTNGIYFFAGAGPNIGLTSSPSIFTYEDEVTALGKIGVNAMLGVGYKLPNIPLSLSFHFRPGYAYIFGEEEYNCLDWDLGLGIHYCF